MPLQPDDTVCFCFHVSLRKIETFCRAEHPQHPSQISDCLSAGTGCGWCVPMLKKIHARCCPHSTPWWRQIPAENAESNPADSPSPPPAPAEETLDAESYKSGRAKYLKEGKGTPPSGAEI